MNPGAVVVFALLLGLITGAIARHKGYSFFAWWLFGAAIFILALPMILLSKPNSRRIGTCPYCMSRVPAQATACPHCTRSITPRVTRVNVKCPHCGFKGDIDAATQRWSCPQCGKSSRTSDSFAVVTREAPQ